MGHYLSDMCPNWHEEVEKGIDKKVEKFYGMFEELGAARRSGDKLRQRRAISDFVHFIKYTW